MNREEYDRVTAVLSYFSDQDYVDYQLRVGKKEAKAAGNAAKKFGTAIHEMVQGKEVEDSFEVSMARKAWEKWLNDYEPKDIVAGMRLYDDSLMFSGEPDFEFNHGNDLVDVKSSIVIRPDYYLQLGGYYILMGRIPKRLWILRLSKQTGFYEFARSEEYGMTTEECAEGFLGALSYVRAHRRLRDALQPKEKVYDSGD